MNLRTILLSVALISLFGIIAESIRRRRLRHRMQTTTQTMLAMQPAAPESDFDDGIIGKARVIRPADKRYNRHPQPSIKKMPVQTQDDDTGDDKVVSYIQKVNQNGLITFYLMPKADIRMNGAEIKQVLFDCGFEYGNMKIFNFYDTKGNIKDLQFCLASAFEPGTFDLAQMINQEFLGLCCFMTTNRRNSRKVFRVMLDKVEQLATLLNVELYDDKHRPCSQAYINKCQQRTIL